MAEKEREFLCPYCGETISIQLDVSAGEQQKFTQDCEVCCRPMKIELEWKAGEVVSFRAEPED